MKNAIHDFKKQLVTFTLLIIVAIAIIGWLVPGSKNTVVLNEVCCYNDTIIYDRLGVYNDYIEIYNSSSDEVDISGFHISDDKHNLTKYTFPENSFIESDAYRIIWASEAPFEVVDDEYYSYLRFRLKAGETVYLSEPSGNVIDKIKIPENIMRDVSYSKLANDAWDVVEATPGEMNSDKPKEADKLLDYTVNFNVSSGFYKMPFWLEMTTDGNCDIFYTLDGSEPTTNSFKYEKPIWIEDVSGTPNRYACINNISLLKDVYVPDYPVEKANVIRAIAVNHEGLKGSESTATYFVGFDGKPGFENIPVISLVTDPENLFGYEKGIYVTGKVWDLNRDIAAELAQQREDWMYFTHSNYTSRGKGWKPEAFMQYFDRMGNVIYSQMIRLKIHGEWSRACNQKSFGMIALPELDGKQYVCEGLFGQSENSLILRTGGTRDIYATKIRDVLNQQLVADRNIGIQAYEPCQVFLDGEYWGLYNLQERIEESYFVSHYSVDKDNLIVYKNYTVIAGEQEEEQLYNDVVDFAVKNDLAKDEYYKQIQQMIDIQSYIDYYCFQIYVANCDSVGNNFGRWRVRVANDDKYGDGRWRWFLYDTDDSAGLVPGRSDADTDSFKEGNWQKNALDDELFTALIQNEEFKEQFIKTFMDMANYNFDSEKVSHRIDELADLYCSAAVVSHRRFLDKNYREDEYWDAISVIKDFYRNRYQYITAYLKEDFSLSGDLKKVEIERAEIPGGTVRLNTLVIQGDETFSGKYYSDYDISLHVDTYEGYQFVGWDINGDMVSGSDIILKLDINYDIKPIWKEKD